jgi:hypothetical protein
MMKMLAGKVLLSLVPVLGLLVSGCGAFKLAPYNPPPIDAYKAAVTKNGLTIGILPLTGTDELNRHFGTDLKRDSGVIPVHVIVTNKSPSTSFMVTRENARLQHKRSGQSFQQGAGKLPGESETNVGTTLVWVGAVACNPLSVPLILIGAQQAMNATVIRKTLVDNEIYTKTVGPGASVCGFLYFQLPPKTIKLSDCSVVLKPIALDTQAKDEFELPLE